MGFAISVDLDHTQVLLTFLEVFLDFMAIVMFVFSLKLLQQFKQDGVAHLVPTSFCLLEEQVVLIL